jgi:hypothetical protein
MNLERREALDLFRKWLGERSLIRCQAQFATHAFSLKGRILEVRENELRIFADDMNSELVLRLTNNLGFGYGDSRIVTGKEAEDYVCCLMVFFEPIPDVGDPETVALAEIREGDNRSLA